MKKNILSVLMLCASTMLGSQLCAQTALKFDGSNDYIEAPAISAINTIGTGDFTIEARIRASSVNSYSFPAIVSNRTSSGSGFILFLNTGSGTSAGGRLWLNINGTNYPCSNSPALNDNQCHHVAVVRQGSNLSFYIDGALNTTRPVIAGGDNINSTGTLRIGHDQGNASATYFNGDISEVRVWNTARTAALISANKSVSISGSEANLKGYWRLNEGTAQTAYSSNMSNLVNATLGSTSSADANDPLWTASCASVTPITAGYAARFDGFNDYIEAPADPAINNIGTGDFTIEARIKASSVNNFTYPTILSTRDASGNGIDVFLNTGSSSAASGKLWINIEQTNYICYNSPNLADNQTHHIAVVRQGTNIKFYIDGVLNTTGPVYSGADNINSTVGPRIGHDRLMQNDSYFNGEIGEVRFWNVARMDQQISDNKAKSLTGSEGNLVGYWRLNEQTGQTAFSSNNSNLVNATLGSSAAADANDPTWASSPVGVVKKYGAAFEYPVNAGTIAIGGGYVATSNNAPASGFDNDYGQNSDDIFYSFTIAQTSLVTVDFCASSFDTYLSLLKSNKQLVLADDDHSSSNGGPVCSFWGSSSFSKNLSAGTYYIVAEGFYGNTGDITARIAVSASTGAPIARVAVDDNTKSVDDAIIKSGNSSNEIFVSPNPISSGSLNFGRNVSRFVLSDVTGSIIAEGANADHVDVDGMQKGIYFINLDGRTQKVVVQ